MNRRSLTIIIAVCLVWLGSFTFAEEGALPKRAPVPGKMRDWVLFDASALAAAIPLPQKRSEKPDVEVPNPLDPIPTPPEDAEVAEILTAWDAAFKTGKPTTCKIVRWEYFSLVDLDQADIVSEGQLYGNDATHWRFVTVKSSRRTNDGRYEASRRPHFVEWDWDGKSLGVQFAPNRNPTRTELTGNVDLPLFATLAFYVNGHARELADRYWLKRTIPGTADDLHTITLFPRYQSDRNRFEGATIVLGEDLLPTAVEIRQPSLRNRKNEPRTIYEFSFRRHDWLRSSFEWLEELDLRTFTTK